MDAAGLRAMQAPIKERYKADPKAGWITLKAKGTLDDTNIACKVETGRALAVARPAVTQHGGGRAPAEPAGIRPPLRADRAAARLGAHANDPRRGAGQPLHSRSPRGRTRPD